MATVADRKAALAAVREAWNTFRALFIPASITLAGIPELKTVLKEFKAVADTATASQPVISKAITDVGGLESPVLTPAGLALAKRLSADISGLLQSFEATTGLKIIAVSLERTPTVTVGEVTVVE